MKPSNCVEEKTKLIISIMFDGALISQKQSVLRREEVHFKSVMNRCFFSGTQTDSLSGYSGLVICGDRKLGRETAHGSSSD
ncbi:hypothetical protein, partial [Vibrio breoganii]|uniref:hypothetical protein n=1 Tax=Vibrio breoganii TaxID=553239 RepID=UPI001A7E06AD